MVPCEPGEGLLGHSCFTLPLARLGSPTGKFEKKKTISDAFEAPQKLAILLAYFEGSPCMVFIPISGWPRGYSQCEPVFRIDTIIVHIHGILYDILIHVYNEQ